MKAEVGRRIGILQADGSVIISLDAFMTPCEAEVQRLELR
jgi:hypothetical protein